MSNLAHGTRGTASVCTLHAGSSRILFFFFCVSVFSLFSCVLFFFFNLLLIVCCLIFSEPFKKRKKAQKKSIKSTKFLSKTPFTDMTEFSVFVSRIPEKWTEKLFFEHFQTLGFGEVSSVELFSAGRKQRNEFTRRGAGNICFAFKNTGFCDKGDLCMFSHTIEVEASSTPHIGCGYVYFTTKEAVDAALEQGTLHVSHRTVKISAFCPPEERSASTLCHAWAKNACTHGSSCKFSHNGPGGCAKVGIPMQGRKFHCLAFKTKGKCSKGESCNFMHVTRESASASKNVSAKNEDSGTTKGICYNFKKKGKCRKVLKF